MRTRTLTLGTAHRTARPHAPSILTAFRRIRNWLQVSRERRQLDRLTPEIMRDIGIDPLEARREAGRRFWDLPAGRL